MLATRLITASCLLGVMLVALFMFTPLAWACFTWLMIGLALWEYSCMLRMPPLSQWGYLLLSTIVASVCWGMSVRLPVVIHILVLVFWLIVLPCWLVQRWTLTNTWLAKAVGWLFMFPAWFALVEWRLYAESTGAYSLLILMGLVWVADIAAYFVGRSFGWRKLAPDISPSKSWEGVYASVIAVILYCWLVTSSGWMPMVAALGYIVVTLFAVFFAVMSVLGDLLESWLKRSAGIKDSSRLLPGHGGVYDRIDSLIAVLAVSNAFRVLGGLS